MRGFALVGAPGSTATHGAAEGTRRCDVLPARATGPMAMGALSDRETAFVGLLVAAANYS